MLDSTEVAMLALSNPSQDQIDCMRAFNRFYTRQIGLLE